MEQQQQHDNQALAIHNPNLAHEQQENNQLVLQNAQIQQLPTDQEITNKLDEINRKTWSLGLKGRKRVNQNINEKILKEYLIIHPEIQLNNISLNDLVLYFSQRNLTLTGILENNSPEYFLKVSEAQKLFGYYFGKNFKDADEIRELHEKFKEYKNISDDSKDEENFKNFSMKKMYIYFQKRNNTINPTNLPISTLLEKNENDFLNVSEAQKLFGYYFGKNFKDADEIRELHEKFKEYQEISDDAKDQENFKNLSMKKMYIYLKKKNNTINNLNGDKLSLEEVSRLKTKEEEKLNKKWFPKEEEKQQLQNLQSQKETNEYDKFKEEHNFLNLCKKSKAILLVWYIKENPEQGFFQRTFDKAKKIFSNSEKEMLSNKAKLTESIIEILWHQYKFLEQNSQNQIILSEQNLTNEAKNSNREFNNIQINQHRQITDPDLKKFLIKKIIFIENLKSEQKQTQINLLGQIFFPLYENMFTNEIFYKIYVNLFEISPIIFGKNYKSPKVPTEELIQNCYNKIYEKIKKKIYDNFFAQPEFSDLNEQEKAEIKNYSQLLTILQENQQVQQNQIMNKNAYYDLYTNALKSLDKNKNKIEYLRGYASFHDLFGKKFDYKIENFMYNIDKLNILIIRNPLANIYLKLNNSIINNYNFMKQFKIETLFSIKKFQKTNPKTINEIFNILFILKSLFELDPDAQTNFFNTLNNNNQKNNEQNKFLLKFFKYEPEEKEIKNTEKEIFEENKNENLNFYKNKIQNHKKLLEKKDRTLQKILDIYINQKYCHENIVEKILERYKSYFLIILMWFNNLIRAKKTYINDNSLADESFYNSIIENYKFSQNWQYIISENTFFKKKKTEGIYTKLKSIGIYSLKNVILPLVLSGTMQYAVNKISNSDLINKIKNISKETIDGITSKIDDHTIYNYKYDSAGIPTQTTKDKYLIESSLNKKNTIKSSPVNNTIIKKNKINKETIIKTLTNFFEQHNRISFLSKQYLYFHISYIISKNLFHSLIDKYFDAENATFSKIHFPESLKMIYDKIKTIKESPNIGVIDKATNKIGTNLLVGTVKKSFTALNEILLDKKSNDNLFIEDESIYLKFLYNAILLENYIDGEHSFNSEFDSINSTGYESIIKKAYFLINNINLIEDPAAQTLALYAINLLEEIFIYKDKTTRKYNYSKPIFLKNQNSLDTILNEQNSTLNKIKNGISKHAESIFSSLLMELENKIL